MPNINGDLRSLNQAEAPALKTAGVLPLRYRRHLVPGHK